MHLAAVQQVRPEGVALLLAGVGLRDERLDLLLARAVEDRGGDVQPQHLRRPAQVRLQDLADVHARGHAERVEHDLDRRAVREVRHVLLGQDPGDDALVAVAAGHLVAHGQLALHGDEDLDQLDDARGQLVAALQAALLLGEERLQDLDLPLRLVDDLVQALLELPGHAELEDVRVPQLREHLGGEGLPLRDHLLAAQVHEVGGGGLAVEQVLDPLVPLVLKDANLVLQVLLHHEELGFLDLPGPVVLLDALAGEDLHVDHDALDAGRAVERGVAHVAGLLAEDRPQQLLLRGELGLALGRDLAHQDVARLDARRRCG